MPLRSTSKLKLRRQILDDAIEELKIKEVIVHSPEDLDLENKSFLGSYPNSLYGRYGEQTYINILKLGIKEIIKTLYKKGVFKFKSLEWLIKKWHGEPDNLNFKNDDYEYKMATFLTLVDIWHIFCKEFPKFSKIKFLENMKTQISISVENVLRYWEPVFDIQLINYDEKRHSNFTSTKNKTYKEQMPSNVPKKLKGEIDELLFAHNWEVDKIRSKMVNIYSKTEKIFNQKPWKDLKERYKKNCPEENIIVYCKNLISIIRNNFENAHDGGKTSQFTASDLKLLFVAAVSIIHTFYSKNNKLELKK